MARTCYSFFFFLNTEDESNSDILIFGKWYCWENSQIGVSYLFIHFYFEFSLLPRYETACKSPEWLEMCDVRHNVYYHIDWSQLIKNPSSFNQAQFFNISFFYAAESPNIASRMGAFWD